MKRRDVIKSLSLLPLGAVAGQSPKSIFNSITDDTRLIPADLSKINPGSYDGTWWNRTPIRLIQTNLPEVEGNMGK